IIALLTFLVGAVIAFLGATVLANFGATIYTVNLVVFSFLREFAVLLTAILMAGRTASAFTAQIGSMKANE
ncbi:ABC transporter permease, partial [Pseudomonas aeruginosa]